VSRRSWVLGAVAAAGLVAPGRLPPPARTAITGVTIIDGNGGPPVESGVILVSGERIEAVGPAAAVRIPTDARIVRLEGKYVVPGFIDMHAHVAFGPAGHDSTGYWLRYDPDASRRMTTTLLQYGITTIRNPGGPTAESIALRDDVRLGRLVGPRIFTAGAILDQSEWRGLTTKVVTEADVRAEVDRQAAIGVDYIKLYAGLTPKLVEAGIDQAHRHGIKTIGHLFATTWTAAATAGIDGLVHVTPGSPLLLTPVRRAEFLKHLRGSQFMLEWFDYVDYESTEYGDMVRALVSHHVSVDPTLVVFEAMAWGDDPRITASPDLATAPQSLLSTWRDGFQLTQGWKPEDFAVTRRSWPRVLEFVKRLHDAGVSLTVGTDVPNPWIAPGTSFHRELSLLVSAGLTPADVIRMATKNGAEALGIGTDVGTVTAGKLADLVILDANPLERIENTRSITWVITRGHWWKPAELARTR
jgi:imidazolonepropionase-like amidohydrolase